MNPILQKQLQEKGTGFFNQIKFFRRNVKNWGPFVTGFDDVEDEWILARVQPIARVPQDWQIPAQLLPPIDGTTCMEELKQMASAIADEHKELSFEPIQPGDFVFWDIRMAHTNADTNDTDVIRHVIYHAFLLANEQVNGKLVNAVQKIRHDCTHLWPDYNKKFIKLESNQETIDALPKLTPLGQCMYNMSKYTSDVPPMTEEETQAVKEGMSKVTDRHIAFFKRYGYVVIENALPLSFVQQCQTGISNFFKRNNVPLDLTMNHQAQKHQVTWQNWKRVAGKFGGMVESFWTAEHEQLRLSPLVYGINVALTQQTWAQNAGFWQSPYGAFSPYHLWLFSDRQNVRFPTSWIQ